MSLLDSVPKTWNRNFNQRSKGDPRPFLNDRNTKAALWASQDAYNGTTHSSFDDWSQVASRRIQPLGNGKVVAALGGGDIRLKVYQQKATGAIMIAFEGTTNITGVWQDVQLFQPMKADYIIPGARGSLHSGFASVYQSAKPEIQKILAQYPNAPVTFTGHSMGGAVASIASADDWGGRRVNTISVGAPQIGDDDFSDWYKKSGKSQDRIIQKSDPITIGNLSFTHADDAAWVIGDSDAWVDFKTHGIQAYIDQGNRVNSQLHNNNEDYIYPYAHNFVSAVELGKDIRKAYRYYQAAEEFYEYTKIASGLPLTNETLRQIVFSQEGVVAQGFQTSIDKLTQLQVPTRQDFADIVVARVTELQTQAAVANTSVAQALNLGTKYIDVSDLNVSGLADIAPDVIQPLKNVDVLIDTASKPALDLITDQGTLLTNAKNILSETSDSASNYFKLITESDSLLQARNAIKTGASQLDDLARPVTSTISNIYESTEGARNWIGKTLPKGAAVGGFLLNALSFGSGVADIAGGDESAGTIAQTTFAGIGTVVAGVEAAAATGLVSSSVLTASLGAGVTIPVIGQIAAVAGLITFAALEIKKKGANKFFKDAAGKLEDYTVPGALQDVLHGDTSTIKEISSVLHYIPAYRLIPGVDLIESVTGDLLGNIISLFKKKPSEAMLIHSGLTQLGEQAIRSNIDVGIGSAPNGGEAFFEKHADQVHIVDGQLVLKDGGPLIDLIYDPIKLADGSKIHADDPEAYQQGKTAQEAYKKLKEAGVVQGTQIQFVSENYKDFRFQSPQEAAGRAGKSIAGSAVEAARRATGKAASDVPIEAPSADILYKGQPYQDHFLPELTYKGQRILPSENPELYTQVQIANTVYDGLEKFNLGDKTKFIDTYAQEFETNDNQLLINGKDFRDAIFQPIEGVSFSQNPGAYEALALSKYLYTGLVDKGLTTGGLSEQEFLNNYFSHIDVDDKGNIRIDGVDAARYYFDPITDLNGKIFYRIQDQDQFDKVQAFYQSYDDLNDKYKEATGRLLNPKDLWNELSATMRVLSGNQIAFGMTAKEMQEPENQLSLLNQVEQRAIQQNIPINPKKLSLIRKGVEEAAFNNTQGNGFTLSPNGDVLFNNMPLLDNIAAPYIFNGRIYDYHESPKSYINALIYKDQPKYNVGAIPPSLVDVIVNKTLDQTRIPDSKLNTYTGYLTKRIGPVNYTLPEPDILAHEFTTMDADHQAVYQQYQADVEKQYEITRQERQKDFLEYDNPMQKPEPVLRASDQIYEQFVRIGTPMSITKEQFSQLYAQHITFDNNGAILVNGSPSVPVPIPVDYNGQTIYQVSDPSLYNQVRAADAVFQQLVDSGQMFPKDKTSFVDQYKDKFEISDSGLISFQGQTVGGQVQEQPRLSLQPNTSLNQAVVDHQPQATFPNPFDSTKGQIPTPQGGMQTNAQPVNLPQTLDQQSLYNPMQSTDTKISRIAKPIEAPTTQTMGADIEQRKDMQGQYQGGTHSVPGSVGFKPNGEKLRASLQDHLWVVHFENGETDTYPRQRELMGYTLMGNWTGATPLADGGPVNTVDSYMMALHVQRKHSTLLASSYLRQRLQAAVDAGTVNPYKDVREFNIAQEILSMAEGQEIFSVEAMDRDASYNLGARLQQKMAEVDDTRQVPASLPPNIEMGKLQLIPKMSPAENPMKRCIEAAGILSDFAVQNKLRRIYSDYNAYVGFSEEYMRQVSEAQGGTIVPNMKRRLLEGIIVRDDIYEDITTHWIDLLSQPVTKLFEIQ